jgi:hypothetical protein
MGEIDGKEVRLAVDGVRKRFELTDPRASYDMGQLAAL